MVRMLGTALSMVALVAAVALSILTAGSNEVFVALAVVMAALVGASLFGSRPGWFAAAALMGWFAMMVASPFSLTTQQFNGLRRQSRRGDEDAQVLLEFYEALEPYALWLMVALTVFVLVVYLFGVRRSSDGAFRHLLDASDGLAEFCTRVGVAAALLYVPMMIIIVYDVIQRKYLGINPGFTNTQWYSIFTSTKLQEMEWHLHAVLFLLCLGYAYIKDAHVRIELVRETLRPRTRIWIELLGCLFFMVPYCYVVMQYGIENAVRAFNIGESSAAQTGLDHRFIIKSMLPLGFSLIALAGFSVALKCCVYLFGPGSLQQASSYHGGTEHTAIPAANPPKQA
jgi:TRAP-type mannitol/chloroaromatic compound transport system permease small subunit